MLRAPDLRLDTEKRAIAIVGQLVENAPSLVFHLRTSFREQMVRAAETYSSGSEKPCKDERELIDRLVDTTDEIYSDLGMHLGNVGILASVIAQELKNNGHKVDPGLSYKGGAIHDIGKLDPLIYHLVSFPGKLGPTQKETTKLHTDIGYKVLTKFDIPDKTALFALQHHERLNGTGYPQGLSDKDLSLETRVVTVADAVDAMMQDRPGREGKSVPEILKELVKGVGTHFDERVVEAYLRICKNLGYPEL